jgi:hypothetical protein
MRTSPWALFIGACLAATSGRTPAPRVIEVSTAQELTAALRSPLDHVTIQLAPGSYSLTGTPAPDDALGRRADSAIMPVTAGLVVSGRHVRLTGPVNGEAVIVTDADYKIYFKDCIECELERLIVSGSPADSLQDANDTAILATRSSVRIANCSMRDNLPHYLADDSQAGGDGICGREGADLQIEFNEITCNWGIVLQDDARAVVTNNLVQGQGPLAKPRGGAMLIMGDASATVERNHFRNFKKGLSIEGRPTIVCRANVIEEVTGDGITATGYGVGRMRIEENAIYRCGAAGIAVRADGDQKASRNLVVESGRVSPRPSAVWVFGARSDAALRKNTLYDNVVLDDALDRDAPREMFWRARRPWTRTYRNNPVGVDGRHKFYESAFLTRYGRWAD